MRLIFSALIACACLSGCASKVVVTDDQSRLAAKLTQQDAEAIVKRVFARTEEQSGLFGSSAAAFMMNPDILKIESSIVHYAESAKPGVIKDPSDSAPPVFQFDLRKLESIRVVSKAAVNPLLIRSRDGVQLALRATDGTLVNVDVKREYADQLIAVAKYYSPDAL
jgi:uncharacterized protein YceK